nr:hypothetical protein [Tanacetum cinerariifolium]
MSLEEAEKESTESDSDEKAHVTGSMVKSSKKKKQNKFDFVTEDGRKAELIVLLGLEVRYKYYNYKLQHDRYCDKMLNRRAESRITNCDVLTRKGPITFKVNREDDTYKVIPNFKVSDLHLDEWREVIKACPDRKGKRMKRKHADDIHDYFKETKKLKSSVEYGDHLPSTVLNEPFLGMIMFNSYHRQDFVTIEDLKDFSNAMLYTIQEIFFKRHQDPGVEDHTRTFSSFLLAKVAKRNPNPLKQIRTIEQLKQ